MVQPDIWCVVPGAGIGSRMQRETPKQYLPLANKTVAQWTLERLASVDRVSGIVVSLKEADPYWSSISLPQHKRIEQVLGGKDRPQSVLNALDWLHAHVSQDAWVLVHDLARPCVLNSDIDRLIDQCLQSNQGGILATPVVDTLKKGDGNQIATTVDRRDLWHALTPQFFPLRTLRVALQQELKKNHLITDDASAMEAQGEQPLLVMDSRSNIKITVPEDLQMAELILKSQEVL